MIKTKKFEAQKIFAKTIRQMVKNQHLSYIEAVIKYCQEKDINVEDIPKIIDDRTKSKIEEEGQKLNFLPKSSKLPI